MISEISVVISCSKTSNMGISGGCQSELVQEVVPDWRFDPLGLSLCNPWYI